MRTLLPILLLAALAASLATGCGDDDPTGPSTTNTRSYRMGFSGIPPRADFELAIDAIQMWSTRADAAILSAELPWELLLAGVAPESLIALNEKPLAGFYRLVGHEVWVYLDPANGLNRGGESTELVDAGRSITEPEIQAMFRRYAVVMDSMVQPDHMGLALETNLIRANSPPALYAAVRQVANDAAADVRARDASVKLSVSVQVDYAWNQFGGGSWIGIDQDFVDFPFVDELGLSAYPYLAGFDEPEDLPANYFSRLVEGRDIPVAVTEGGWSSATLDDIVSSEDEQRRYIERQAELLDDAGAIAVFQLTFTDLDISEVTPPPPTILELFIHNGLVDVDLNPKPALAAWDAIYARPLE